MRMGACLSSDERPQQQGQRGPEPRKKKADDRRVDQGGSMAVVAGNPEAPPCERAKSTSHSGYAKGTSVHERLLAEGKSDAQLAALHSRLVEPGALGSVCGLDTQQGAKGWNQDAMVAWAGFIPDSDAVLCAVFDGHGPFGHLVSKRVRESLPSHISRHVLLLSSSGKPGEGAADCRGGSEGAHLQTEGAPCLTVDFEDGRGGLTADSDGILTHSASLEREPGERPLPPHPEWGDALPAAGDGQLPATTIDSCARWRDGTAGDSRAPEAQGGRAAGTWRGDPLEPEGGPMRAAREVASPGSQRSWGPSQSSASMVTWDVSSSQSSSEGFPHRPPAAEAGALPAEAWELAIVRAFEDMDREVRLHPSIDPMASGSAAVVAIKQGEDVIVANLGDCRCVMGTERRDDGSTVAWELTVDHKCSVASEKQRLKEAGARVFALEDEPEVERAWLPNEQTPGLALTRAFGDVVLKSHGLSAVPETRVRRMTPADKFLVLACDGVWDVLSTAEVVDLVAAAPARRDAPKLVVDKATAAWASKHPKSKRDDITVAIVWLQQEGASVKRSCASDSPFEAAPPVDKGHGFFLAGAGLGRSNKSSGIVHHVGVRGTGSSGTVGAERDEALATVPADANPSQQSEFRPKSDSYSSHSRGHGQGIGLGLSPVRSVLESRIKPIFRGLDSDSSAFDSSEDGDDSDRDGGSSGGNGVRVDTVHTQNGLKFEKSDSIGNLAEVGWEETKSRAQMACYKSGWLAALPTSLHADEARARRLSRISESRPLGEWRSNSRRSSGEEY